MNRAVSRIAYRLILRLHPTSFRDEFGSEMLWIFDQEQRPGAVAHLFLDGTLSLLRQRFRSQNSPGQLSIASGVMITGPGCCPVPPAGPAVPELPVSRTLVTAGCGTVVITLIGLFVSAIVRFSCSSTNRQ